MAIATNILTGTILAPVVAILSAISLATLQRGLDWLSAAVKNPQKGFLRQAKPYLKVVDTAFERILAGNKFTVTTTNVLLMAVVILLLCLLLEGAERPKKVMIVDKNKSKET